MRKGRRQQATAAATFLTRAALAISLAISFWSAWALLTGIFPRGEARKNKEIIAMLRDVRSTMAAMVRPGDQGWHEEAGEADVAKWSKLLTDYRAGVKALQSMRADLEAHTDHLLLTYSYMNQAAEIGRSLLVSEYSAEEREVLEADYRANSYLAIASMDEVLWAIGATTEPESAERAGEERNVFAVICALSILAAALLSLQELRIFVSKADENVPSPSHIQEKYDAVHAFLEAAAAPLLVVDKDGKIVRFNQTCVEITGHSFEEVRGRFIWDLFLEPARAEQIRNLFTEPGRDDFPEHMVLEWQAKDGARIGIDWSLARLSDDTNAVKYVVAVGNPEVKPAETKEISSVKWAERLAATVSLSFNNLLTAINGYSDLLLNSMDADTPLRKDVEEIKSAGERAALLSHQLQVYGHAQRFLPKRLDLNELIRGHQRWLGAMLGDEIELVATFEDNRSIIEADPVQLRRMLEILATNARDAMPDGGRFGLRTYYAQQNQETVVLEASDSGCGMDSEVLSHLFEPFFTTKPAGRGTGLGLTTVGSIVTRSGGTLEVDSTPGQGATFRIQFPAPKESTTEEAPAIKAPAARS